MTSLLYGDIEAYLAREHPGTVIYALTAKICIVYGAFVGWQFKPDLQTPIQHPRQLTDGYLKRAVGPPRLPIDCPNLPIWTAMIICVPIRGFAEKR